MSEPCTSSGELAVGTTAVCGVPALLTSLSLAPAAADCSIKVYDNASAASGTILTEITLKANTGSVQYTFESPIYSTRGLTAVVAGTGAIAHVMFQRVA